MELHPEFVSQHIPSPIQTCLFTPSIWLACLRRLRGDAPAHATQVQPGDVLVEQGRHAVSLGEMLMRPVFWPFSGQVRAPVRCGLVSVRDVTGRGLNFA